VCGGTIPCYKAANCELKMRLKNENRRKGNFVVKKEEVKCLIAIRFNSTLFNITFSQD
jgi:hypothetical protein